MNKQPESLYRRWHRENADRPLWYRVKYSPPPTDCAPRQKDGTPTTNL